MKPYPPIFQFLPFASAIVLILSMAAALLRRTAFIELSQILLLPAAIGSIVAYTVQWRWYRERERPLNGQLMLILFAGAAPAVGAVIGNIQGSITFHNPSSAEDTLVLVPALLLIGAGSALVLCSIANAIGIAAQWQSRLLDILGTIAKVILFVLIIAFSYLVGSIMYALRDPSAE